MKSINAYRLLLVCLLSVFLLSFSNCRRTAQSVIYDYPNSKWQCEEKNITICVGTNGDRKTTHTRKTTNLYNRDKVGINNLAMIPSDKENDYPDYNDNNEAIFILD